MLKILCGGTGILRIKDQKKGLTERVPTFDADQAAMLQSVEAFMTKYQLHSIAIWTEHYHVERKGFFDLLRGVSMRKWGRVKAWWRGLIS